MQKRKNSTEVEHSAKCVPNETCYFITQYIYSLHNLYCFISLKYAFVNLVETYTFSYINRNVPWNIGETIKYKASSFILQFRFTIRRQERCGRCRKQH